MAQVKLDKVFKRYVGDKGKEVTAVENFNLDINDHEFVVFVGPSGCGKSTTLRMIAGLEEISDGEISIDNRVVNDVAPKNRDIAMVFQNYALYPHMSVYENMAFGLKLQKVPKAEIDRRVRAAATILGIETFLDRKPKALSGGQRQRVALGRAIVREPKVFLFDEPLSNLDAKMRVQMRAEITKLHRSLKATMIYVTHDQIEAMTMGERIVVMKDGMIQQVASPIELYNSPVNLFVAGFLGSPPMNIVAGTLTKEGNSLIFLEKAGGCIRVDLGDRPSAAGHLGKEVVMGLRPEDCEIVTESGSIPKNSFTAMVEISEPVGAETYYYLKTGAHAFTARRAGMGDHSDTGKVLSFKINGEKAHLFDPLTTFRLT